MQRNYDSNPKRRVSARFVKNLPQLIKRTSLTPLCSLCQDKKLLLVYDFTFFSCGSYANFEKRGWQLVLVCLCVCTCVCVWVCVCVCVLSRAKLRIEALVLCWGGFQYAVRS